MQAHLRLAASRLLQQGLLKAEPLALHARALQQRAASSRSSRARGRDGGHSRGAVRASWGLESKERVTERGGSSRDRERPQYGRGGGGGEVGRSRQEWRGGGSRARFDRGPKERWGGSGERDGGGRGGAGRYGGQRERSGAPGGRGELEFDWQEEEGGRGDWGQRGQQQETGGGGWGRGGPERRGGGRDRGGGGGWGPGRGQGRGGEDAEQQQPRPPTLREQWVGDYVYGVSPVLAALRAGRREVHALYVQEGMQLAKRKDKAAVQAVRALAQQTGARVVEAPKHDLNLVTDSRPHQGLVLDCGPLEFEALNTFPDPPPGGREASGAVPLWLCLDEVMDPQNFGAALRSAFFLGVSGVLTCHRNSAPLSAVVSKASAGAMELIAVHACNSLEQQLHRICKSNTPPRHPTDDPAGRMCRSMPQTLADAKRRGWQVLGAASEEGALPCASFTLDRPTVLVVGNEGYGVRPVIRRLCDATLRIDGDGLGRGGFGGAAELVDSLNVSVATGILLHQLINSAPRPAGEPAS